VLIVAVVHGRLPRHILRDVAYRRVRAGSSQSQRAIWAHAVAPAADLGGRSTDPPGLLVVLRRFADKIVEQAALDGVVVLEQSGSGCAGDTLDRFETARAPRNPGAAAGPRHALSGSRPSVKRPGGPAAVLDALLDTGRAGARGRRGAASGDDDILRRASSLTGICDLDQVLVLALLNRAR